MLQLLNGVNAAALARAYRQFPAKGSTLDIDFVNNRQRVAGVYGDALNGVTFTRSTTGTYFDATGTMQTAAINAPRFDYDPVSLRPRGLLIEGARANILLNSDTGATQSVAVSATAYTLSFYGTGTVTLSGVSTAGPLVGTGANNRVSLTFTPTAGTLTLTISGMVTNWQLEAGAFATSYIPTTAASTTRGADVVSMTAPNFNSWYSQFGIVCLAEFSLLGLLAGQTVYHIGNGGLSDRISTRNEGVSIASRCIANETLQAMLTAQTVQAGTVLRHTFSVFENDFAVFGDGAFGFDATGILPSPVSISIGNAYSSAFLHGHIRRLTAYPQRLPNKLLQYLSKLTA